MMVLYTLLMSFLVIAVYPVSWILRAFGNDYALRRLSAPLLSVGDYAGCVWIHAASVGEAGIAFSMAGQIKKRRPGVRIVITTITSTGLDRIRGLNAESGGTTVSDTFLAPFDHPLITKRFVRKIRPDSFILVETELWPWTILAVSRFGAKITVINGKLGKRSFRRYMIFRKSIAPVVSCISLFCVQTRTFSRRYHMLGVPHEKIKIIGNVKFDGLPDVCDYDKSEVRKSLGIAENAKVFVAGSTRPGEESIIVDAFKRIMADFDDVVLVIAPRHLNRVSEVEKILGDSGIEYGKRSNGDMISELGKSTLILDTLGELLRTFACADASFVGGSLLDYGGHNPLEPAALGIPVLFGPFMEQTGSKELLSDGAAVLVHDSDELFGILAKLFTGGDKLKEMTAAGPSVVQRFKGTLSRTLNAMENRDLI